MSKILNRSTLLQHWKNHGVLPAMRLLITEGSGTPFNGLTWMVDLILKTLRFPTVLIVTSRCFYYPPVESWYGPLIPSPIFAWLIGLLGVLVLFGFSLGSIVGLFIHGGFCYLTSRLPLKSRLTLQSYKKAKKEESLKELLQKL
jgi:hypothetical protein